jgi:hypothetical protein
MLQQLDGFHILLILTNIKRRHKDNVSMHALHAWPKPVTSLHLCSKTGKNPQQEIPMWSQQPRVGKRCLGLLRCRQYIPLSFCKCHKNLLLGGTCHEACKEAATCWVSVHTREIQNPDMEQQHSEKTFGRQERACWKKIKASTTPKAIWPALSALKSTRHLHEATPWKST